MDTPHALWALPFAALLLAIAALPLLPHASHWWERHSSKLLVGLALGAIVLAHYAFRGFGFHHEDPGLRTVIAVLDHAILRDYVPFIVLLFSLYTISGGLQLKGDLDARPAVNAALLAIGAGLASLIGTTGASMLLIRPLLHSNRRRKHVRHTVVFFIFLVSNIGGALLPIGDPPLFLGYLQGVPFFWTLRLAGAWAFCVAALLLVYYAWDRRAYAMEDAESLRADRERTSPLRLHGGINFLWLIGVVAAVACIKPGRPWPGTNIEVVDHAREALMLALTGLSLATTPRGLRKEVEFTYASILEVACLFLGIFLTMQVPLEILRARGASLGLTTPTQFFWASGLLSGFLDNAPTYSVFFETARTLPASTGVETVALTRGAIPADLLAAISMGSVFMGANTYIGNGPNFMVKSIAERHGVAMPGFFGYLLYSVPVLMPLFAALTFLLLP